MSRPPEITGDSRLHFAVLGTFRVDRDGRKLDLGPRLQRMLLAILVMEVRHIVPVDRLIDLLWSDEPPSAAMASVQAYVSQLRRVLEPARQARAPATVLVTQDPGYTLRVPDDRVDALRFRALARRAHDELAGGQPAAATAHLDEALALWRGDPLPEFSAEPWAVPTVAALTEAHDLAAEDRLEAWLALGRHAQAVTELEAMVQARPLRERRWAQLIIAAGLHDRLRQVAAGHGGAVALTGEPGAGKTTIAEAAAQLAAACGVTAVWARCLDSASAPAYWPWSQVLRGLPGGQRVEAAVRHLDGGVAGGEEDSVRLFRAYQAVAAALGEAAAGAPVLVVVDDLHAADNASVALLQLLAGDLHRMRTLFLFTVRDTEPSPAMAQALGELLRHPGAERMAVGGFTPDDVAALVERLTAGPPDADAVAALMSRTGGNPLYTTELVRLISSGRRDGPLTAGDVRALDVPSGVRDVLLRRLHRLPDDTQSLLTVAAVAGPELQLDLLEQVTGLDTEHLLLDLEPAIAAGLVMPDESGWGFRFRHPLIHDSLYTSIGRVERARLHARIAAALERAGSAGTAVGVARLAHHYLSAGPFGDPARAVRYAREAAGCADRQGAWQDAARHLEQALTAISAVLPDADATRCDVLVELGQARRSAGLIRAAHSAFQESISLADRIGDEDRMLAAAVAFGAPQLWGPRDWGENDMRLVTLLERQLGRVAGRDPGRRIRILATLATELYFDEAVHRGWGYANEALDAARRFGGPAELGIAVSAYLLSAVVTDHVPEIRAVIDEMLDGSHPDLTPRVEAILRANLLTERIRFGELTRFDTEFPQVWRLATDVLHSPELQGQLHFVHASRYLVAGDTERGAGLAELGFRSLGGLADQWRQPQRIALDSCMALVTGTLGDHAEEMAARLDQPDHPSVPHLAAPAAALGFALRGDLERARQITSRWFAPPPRSWAWPQAIAYWAQVATVLGMPDPGWLYDRLAPHAGEVAIVGVGADCGGAVDSLLAGLAWRLGRPDEAAGRARAGLELEQRVGSGTWISRTVDLISRIGAGPPGPVGRQPQVPSR